MVSIHHLARQNPQHNTGGCNPDGLQALVLAILRHKLPRENPNEQTWIIPKSESGLIRNTPLGHIFT